jgi:hypothetical protein
LFVENNYMKSEFLKASEYLFNLTHEKWRSVHYDTALYIKRHDADFNKVKTILKENDIKYIGRKCIIIEVNDIIVSIRNNKLKELLTK